MFLERKTLKKQKESQQVFRFKLDVPCEIMTEFQASDMLQIIYDNFEMISTASLTTYTTKVSPVFLSKSVKVSDYRYPFKEKGFTDYVINMFKYPTSTLSIHEFKKDNPQYYVSKHIKLQLGKTTTYNEIPVDLFEHLQKCEMIAINETESRSKKTVYEFTAKFYKYVAVFTESVLTPVYLKRLIQLYENTPFDAKNIFRYKNVIDKVKQLEIGKEYSLKKLRQETGFATRLKRKSIFHDINDAESEFAQEDN